MLASCMKTTRLKASRFPAKVLRDGGLALLLGLLSGCASYGGYPGSNSQRYPDGAYPGGQYGTDQYGANQLVGTVQGVDLNSGRVILAAEGSGYRGNGRVELYFDQRTQLVYQGRAQSVEGLEAGDRIRVDAVPSNGRLWARTIEVVANVRDGYGGGYQDGGSYGDQGGDLRGNIGYVDTRARVIEIDRAGGGYGNNRVRVRYDERTVVEYRGQRYRPENLERGDLVRIQARQSGNDWLAERIWVESDASSR